MKNFDHDAIAIKQPPNKRKRDRNKINTENSSSFNTYQREKQQYEVEEHCMDEKVHGVQQKNTF